MTTVRYSDDEKYAYVEGANRFDFWLSLEPFPAGTYEKQFPNPGFLTPQGVQFKHPNGTSANYERLVLSFMFWSVKSYRHIVRELPDDDLFVLDYKLHQAWRKQNG